MPLNLMMVNSNVSVFSVQVLQHLLELGADISLRTRHGWTGMHICAIRGCTICLRVCKVAGNVCQRTYIIL